MDNSNTNGTDGNNIEKISMGRVITYIVTISVLGLIIVFLVLTVKRLKYQENKND